MKQVLFIIGLTLLIATSCKKDENSPTYTQDQLTGTWENIVKDENGDTHQMIITPTSISEKVISANSTFTVNYESYSFDGKKISCVTMGFDANFVINELTATKLIMTYTMVGFSEKSEYKKI